MIIINSTQELQIVLTSPVTSYECPITVSWADDDTTTLSSDAQAALTTGTSAVTVLAAPPAGTARQLKSFTLVNEDTTTIVATLRLYTGATGYSLCTVSLPVGYRLSQIGDIFSVFNTAGGLVNGYIVAGVNSVVSGTGISVDNVDPANPIVTLADTAVVPGSYGAASQVPTFTVDAKGRLTAAANVSIAIGAGAVSGLAAVATSGSAADLTTGTIPAARIADSTITLAMNADIAVQTILGNNTGLAGPPVALTAAQTKVVLSLDNVENTALSTWVGSSAITTLGTITTGVWNGTPIGVAYLGTGPLDTTTFLRGDGTFNNFLTGPLGIGGAPAAATGISLNGSATGATTMYGISNTRTIQSDVTTAYYGVASLLSTQASAFTLDTLADFYAGVATLGAGSAITSRMGFYADALSLGTNNYGFYSAVAAGTNNWAFYGAGTAPSYFGGNVGIGSSPGATVQLYLAKPATGNATVYSFRMDTAVQSDVTGAMSYAFINPSTAAAAFTCSNLYMFRAGALTAGAGSTITNSYAFYAAASSGATNHYAFYGLSAANALSNWNLYCLGSAPNYMAGSLGIGTTTLTGATLNASKTMTGAATAYGILSGGIAQSDVTTTAQWFSSGASTVAALFTLSNLNHFAAIQNTIGVNSTVNTQTGFNAASSLTGATLNIGFRGVVQPIASGGGITARTIIGAGVATNVVSIQTSVAHGFVVGQRVTVNAGTNTQLNGSGLVIASVFTTTLTNDSFTYARTTADVTFAADTGTITPAANYNAYFDGTAPNYFAGSLGIGSTTLTGYGLRNKLAITGATTAYAQINDGVFQSDVTTSGYYYRSTLTTQAANFTLTSGIHYAATQGTLGVGSTVTTQIGFYALSSLVGATNNYGVRSQIPDVAAGGSTSNRTVIAAGVTSNVVSVQTSVAHGYVVGQSVTNILGTNTQLNGSGIIIASVTTTTLANDTFTFSRTTPDVTFAADTGTVKPAVNYNAYFDGGAPNYFLGSVGIGAIPTATVNLLLLKNITGGVSSYAQLNQGTVQSDVTTLAGGFRTNIGTQATAFTLTTLSHYEAVQNVIGAGSTVTAQQGFVAGATLIGATTNYGFRGLLAVSGTSRWNEYMDGTAPSFWAGQTAHGTNTIDASAQITVNSTTKGFLPPRMTTTQRDAISTPTAGLVIYNSTTNKLNVRTASAWEAVTSA